MLVAVFWSFSCDDDNVEDKSKCCEENSDTPIENSPEGSIPCKNCSNEPWVQKKFTQADVDALKARRVLFAHKSVGINMVDGMKREASDIGFSVYTNNLGQALGALNSGRSFADFDIGNDGNLTGKISAFEAAMRTAAPNVDIAFFKFCYNDFRNDTDINALTAAYQSAMNRLEADFKNVIFVHVTAPLYVNGQNKPQHTFNEWLRKKYGGRVFDLAKLEATDSNGSPVSVNGLPALAHEWSSDGSHLNSAGGSYVGGALIAFLAQVE